MDRSQRGNNSANHLTLTWPRAGALAALNFSMSIKRDGSNISDSSWKPRTQLSVGMSDSDQGF